MEALTDDQIKLTEKLKSVKENIVGKGENAGYQHFSPFLPMFSKVFFLRGINSQDCMVKINPFPNDPWFLLVCSTSLLKKQWEKEKLLITSNFSCSHSVFYPFGELSAILSNFKLSSASSFSLEEFKICRLGKG